MSLKFTAGDLTIHRIIEQETTFLPALDLFPQLTPDLLAQNRDWMRKAGAIDENDVLILCFQSYVVRTPHHTILIDSCIGNDKSRPLRPKWNMKTDDTYMRALKAAGFSVEDIDFVMCTHLHVDHVGWNTRLEGGLWVPTFPKARYVFGKAEYNYWAEQHDAAGRGKDDAVFCGDIMHSPLQTRYPELLFKFDVDPALAAKTRRDFMERYCDTDTLCCTAHFPSPSTGRIRRRGNGFSCEAAS